MRWIKRHKTQSAAVGAMGIGGLVMAFALLNILFGGSEATATSDRPVAQPSIEAPLYVEPDDLGLTDAEPTTPAPAAPAGLPPVSDAAGSSVAVPAAGGLRGQGGVVGLPKHIIKLSMTSKAPIAYVGYTVPSSLDDSSGTVKNPGTSWSRTIIGYGPPDYAQLFSTAGPAGVPVTCTITVDGKVTEKRSTSGPYDQMFCQG